MMDLKITLAQWKELNFYAQRLKVSIMVGNFSSISELLMRINKIRLRLQEEIIRKEKITFKMKIAKELEVLEVGIRE